MYLQQELEKLKSNLSEINNFAPSVSKQNVGWHIYHALMVMSGICSLIENSNPIEYKPKFSILKWGILTTGIIPRGKAKAPKLVVPPETFNVSDLEILISRVELQIKDLENRAENQFYRHHMFGDLNKKQTIKFIGIHTRHHLKIIRDIIKGN